MAEPTPQLTYDDAVRIRGDVVNLQEQLGRIIAEARRGDGRQKPRSVAQIARDLQFTEGRIRQILRAEQDADPTA
ncbi:hypothetical protein AB0C11_27850 [Streptomyces sp. NPDC039016]|uniref:hypothetical protein n=1 Tax=Streptomyces sp. NPDC039016 TaxID=3154330 RepID=UPI0033F65192